MTSQHGAMLPSINEELGHSMLANTPGDYVTPQLDKAFGYATPQMIFNDGLYYRCIYILWCNKAKTKGIKNQGGTIQWCLPYDFVILDGCIWYINTKVWPGEPRCPYWDPTVEALLEHEPIGGYPQVHADWPDWNPNADEPSASAAAAPGDPAAAATARGVGCPWCGECTLRLEFGDQCTNPECGADTPISGIPIASYDPWQRLTPAKNDDVDPWLGLHESDRVVPQKDNRPLDQVRHRYQVKIKKGGKFEWKTYDDVDQHAPVIHLFSQIFTLREPWKLGRSTPRLLGERHRHQHRHIQRLGHELGRRVCDSYG